MMLILRSVAFEAMPLLHIIVIVKKVLVLPRIFSSSFLILTETNSLICVLLVVLKRVKGLSTIHSHPPSATFFSVIRPGSITSESN